MVDYLEQTRVSRAMIRWGGGFIGALGYALFKADRSNAQKVKDAFPEYWEEYLKKSEKLED